MPGNSLEIRREDLKERSPSKSKGNSSHAMGYHNLSSEGNYSYDYKTNKQGYKRIHGKSMTANTSPISSTNRQGSNKKHIQSLNKGSIGFSHSQHVSPSLSKSSKLYRPKKSDKVPMSTSYALAQIGKKTYVVPTSGGNSSDKSMKQSTKGSSLKGNTAYYDALGYGKYSIPDSKSSKRKESKQIKNRLDLKMINDYEEKKAFSMVSNMVNKKEFTDPMNIRGIENINLNKESPLPIRDENGLRLLLQQNKLGKGFNLDYVVMDGGTGGGNSKRMNSYLKNRSSKRSNSESGKIKSKRGGYNKKSKKYFGQSRKNSKIVFYIL